MAFNPKTEYDIQRTNIRIRDFDASQMIMRHVHRINAK